jgi:hypothetical protein
MAVQALMGDAAIGLIAYNIALMVLLLVSLYTIQADELVGERSSSSEAEAKHHRLDARNYGDCGTIGSWHPPHPISRRCPRIRPLNVSILNSVMNNSQRYAIAESFNSPFKG